MTETTKERRTSTRPMMTVADYRTRNAPLYCVYWKSPLGGIAGRKSTSESELRAIVDAKNAELRAMYADPTLDVYEVRRRVGDTWVSVPNTEVT